MGATAEATILHADLDSFFASVEQRDMPRLLGKPVAVGVGVVLAASYEAKAFGVEGGMPGRVARRLCPGLICVPPRMEAYSEASKAVFEVFHDTTPVVEPLSIDEAFLDVGGLRRLVGTPVEIAAQLRADVRRRVGLPITVGIARTKFLAKVASKIAKPDGLLLVEPDEEIAFLHPLPVESLWGVGPKTTEKLNARGITIVADVARLPEPVLVSMLGTAVGRKVHSLANLRDPRPVVTRRRRRSIGAQRALGTRPVAGERLDASLVALVERTTTRLRAAGRTSRTVVIRLRFGDFARATRSHTLDAATDRTDQVLKTARKLLAEAAPLISERGITLIGISLTNLDGEAVQLVLPFAGPTEGLDTTIDKVREKFGSKSVMRAVLLGRDPGIAMPTLPD